MTWYEDNLTAAEALIHRGEATKIGRFACCPDSAAFPCTPAISNDVFVLPQQALHLQRNDDGYFFVEPGGVLFHRAGSELNRRSVSGVGDEAWWFAVHPDLFEAALSRYGLHRHDMGPSFVLPPTLRLALLRLIRLAKQEALTGSVLDAELLALFQEICVVKAGLPLPDAGHRALTVRRRQVLVEKARQQLHAMQEETFDLVTLASAVGASPFHLTRVFREILGMTPGEYVKRLKVGAVTDALLTRDMGRLADLAVELGFSSQSYMNRMVKQTLGQTPSQIRKFA